MRAPEETQPSAPTAPHKLTRRGYTVKKAALTADEMAQVREDLFVIPVNPVRDKMLAERKRWDPDAPDPSDDGFKVYKENAAKLYLPPFYGVQRFGVPAVNELKARGAPIDLLFHGSLREAQQDVAEQTVAHLDAHGMRQLQFLLFEAISNVLQHARARVLRLEACMEGTAVALRVIDDGRGFDASRGIPE